MHEDDLPLDDSSFHEADYEDNEFEDGDFDDASFEDDGFEGDGFEDAADFDTLDSSSLDDSVMRELAVNDENSVDDETTNDFVDSTDTAHTDDADDDESAIAEEPDEELLADDSRPSPQLWSEDVEIPAAATPVVDEPETPAPAAATRQEGQPFVRKTKARELALQMLFQADLNPESSEQDIADQLRDRLPKADLFQFAWDLYCGVVRDQELLDRDIAATATNWRVSRMAATDRNVLRLGAYELQHMDTPYGVVLDEAIDLAKKFGTSQSASFVNGVLDKLVPEAKRPTGASTSQRPNDDSQDATQSPVREPVARGTSAAVGDNVIPANASPEDVAKHSPGKPIAFKRKQVDPTESRPDTGEGDQ